MLLRMTELRNLKIEGSMSSLYQFSKTSVGVEDTSNCSLLSELSNRLLDHVHKKTQYLILEI